MTFKPLGLAAKIIAGQSPESSTYNSTGQGLPFFQGKADFQDMYPTVRIWCTSPKRKEAEPGDILISVRAPVGAVNICNQKSIIGRGLAAIRPSSELDGKFLYYYLKANERQIDALGTGSTFKAITQDTLKKIGIPLPPLNDQIRIAHLLGKVEGLIAQRKQHLQQLDDLLKSLFLEMFGDPVRNEKGWDIDRIGRSIKVQGGFAFKSKDIASSGAIKLVKIANVHFENLTWDDVSYVPDNFFDVYKKFALQEGDLLIALTRPVIKSLNVVKTATVRNEDIPCLLNQRVARFLIDQNQINKRFFLQYCYTEFFRNTVEGLCPPGLQPNVSPTQIEEVLFFYPPIHLQNEFAAIAAKVEGIKSRYQQNLIDLEALYSTLSQQAFKGELDLSRVPLPDAKPQEPQTAVPAADPPSAIHLPDTELLLAALDERAGLKELLPFWLEAYRAQLNGVVFSVQDFLSAAQARIVELHPDNDFELGIDAYELLKAWVFDRISSRELKQTRSIVSIGGKRKFGNEVLLRVRGPSFS